MARKLRVEYPGAIYHLMSRGDRRELIFQDDSDRKLFLETLAEACAKTGWQVHAYCLMPNHFHLVVETPQPNLVAGKQVSVLTIDTFGDLSQGVRDTVSQSISLKRVETGPAQSHICEAVGLWERKSVSSQH